MWTTRSGATTAPDLFQSTRVAGSRALLGDAACVQTGECEMWSQQLEQDVVSGPGE